MQKIQNDRMWESRKNGRIPCEMSWQDNKNSLNKSSDFKMMKHLPRITLYSSASRRNSITSAVGNGLAFDLPGTLLSDIRTVLLDLLPLQIINVVCNDHVIVTSRYHRVFTLIGIVVDAFLYFLFFLFRFLFHEDIESFYVISRINIFG